MQHNLLTRRLRNRAVCVGVRGIRPVHMQREPSCVSNQVGYINNDGWLSFKHIIS